jgi:hypothetical protein
MPRRRIRLTSRLYATPAGEALGRLEAAQKDLRALLRAHEREVDAIEANWGDDDQRKAYRVQRARDDASGQIERLLAEARAAREDAERAIQAMRVSERGTREDRERVRHLLARGVAPAEVLERASTLGEPYVVAALRSELLWHGERAEGDERAEVAELIAECDRAIAATSGGEQRAKNMAAVAYAARRRTFDALAELAIKTVSGTVDPQARMAVGYADAVDPGSA